MPTTLATYATAGQVQMFREMGIGVDLTRDAQLTDLLLASCTELINDHLGISYQVATAYQFVAPVTTPDAAPPWAQSTAAQPQTIALPYVVSSVSSVATTDTASVVIEPLDLDSRLVADRLTLVSTVTAGTATIVANVGLPGGVPKQIQTACALLVADMIRRDVSGFTRQYDPQAGVLSPGSALPRGVADMLRPYRRVTVSS